MGHGEHHRDPSRSTRSTVHLQSEHEVDSAIDTVVTFAFGNAEPLDRYLFRIRAALPSRPSVKELVEAVFQVRGELGPITDEGTRRQNAAWPWPPSSPPIPPSWGSRPPCSASAPRCG